MRLFIAILAAMILAGVATTMSSLIPELTVMGIWGIPALGFVLLVGAIFRVAFYYHPREMQGELAKKYASFVAAGFLCHHLMWSSFDYVLQKGQHPAWIAISVIAGIANIAALTITESEWIILQTQGGEYPILCHVRRFIFVNSSILLLIGNLTHSDGLIRIMKPIVMLVVYTNYVYFAAVYYGVFRPQTNRAWNGSITERLSAWIRFRVEPGRLFITIQIILTVIVFAYLIMESICEVPQKIRLIAKAIFVVTVALTFYAARIYDPRKPPETSTRFVRVIAFFLQFSVAIYTSVYIMFIHQNSDLYAFEVHSIILVVLFLLRAVVTVLMIFEETDIANIIPRKMALNILHIGLYGMSSVFYVLMNIVKKDSTEYVIGQALENTFFYLSTLSILAIVSGKYRDVVVRQVQIQLEICVEQPPPVEQNAPLNLRQVVDSNAINV